VPCWPFALWGAQPPLVKETARYRVSYGILGEVAEATVTFTPDGSPGLVGAGPARSIVHAVGTGRGAVLGFGKTEKHIESDFDTQALKTMRWTITRSTGGETVVDIAEQPQAGAVSLLRKRTGQPDQADSMNRASPVLDPLGLLLRIRLAPPQAPTSFEILDGRALWIVTLSAARPTSDTPRMLRLDGWCRPIYWDGTPDKERTERPFKLFLSDDAYHTPLRLVVPFGMGEARAEIVQLSRPAPRPRLELWRILLRFFPQCHRLPEAPSCGALLPDGSGFPTRNLVLAIPET
jgi:hypothetical protein